MHGSRYSSNVAFGLRYILPAAFSNGVSKLSWDAPGKYM